MVVPVEVVEPVKIDVSNALAEALRPETFPGWDEPQAVLFAASVLGDDGHWVRDDRAGEDWVVGISARMMVHISFPLAFTQFKASVPSELSQVIVVQVEAYDTPVLYCNREVFTAFTDPTGSREADMASYAAFGLETPEDAVDHKQFSVGDLYVLTV